jgi:hypothetical protein
VLLTAAAAATLVRAHSQPRVGFGSTQPGSMTQTVTQALMTAQTQPLLPCRGQPAAAAPQVQAPAARRTQQLGVQLLVAAAPTAPLLLMLRRLRLRLLVARQHAGMMICLTWTRTLAGSTQRLARWHRRTSRGRQHRQHRPGRATLAAAAAAAWQRLPTRPAAGLAAAAAAAARPRAAAAAAQPRGVLVPRCSVRCPCPRLGLRRRLLMVARGSRPLALLAAAAVACRSACRWPSQHHGTMLPTAPAAPPRRPSTTAGRPAAPPQRRPCVAPALWGRSAAALAATARRAACRAAACGGAAARASAPRTRRTASTSRRRC